MSNSKLPSVDYEDADARAVFRWKSVINGYEISTVDNDPDPHPINLFLSALTSHDEALFETCIFRVDKNGERVGNFSHVVREYSSQEKAAQGHDEIVGLFKKGKELTMGDTFTRRDIIFTF